MSESKPITPFGIDVVKSTTADGKKKKRPPKFSAGAEVKKAVDK